MCTVFYSHNLFETVAVAICIKLLFRVKYSQNNFITKCHVFSLKNILTVSSVTFVFSRTCNKSCE